MKWSQSEKTDTSRMRSKRKSVPVRLCSFARCLTWSCFLDGGRRYQLSKSIQRIISFCFSGIRFERDNQICFVLEHHPSDSSANFGAFPVGIDHAVAVPASPGPVLCKPLCAIGAPWLNDAVQCFPTNILIETDLMS